MLYRSWRRYIFSEPTLRGRIRVDALGGEMQTTPLFWATYHNHIYAVELLLRHGADPNFADEVGSNPFLLAIQVRCTQALVLAPSCFFYSAHWLIWDVSTAVLPDHGRVSRGQGDQH